MSNPESSVVTPRRFAWGIFTLVAYWTLLTAGTHLPARWLRGRGIDVAPRGLSRIPHLDKFLHAGGYFGLTFLLVLVLFHRRTIQFRHGAWLLVGIGLHAVADELLQFLVPDRSPDPLDWLADMGGAAAALFFTLLLRKRFLKSWQSI